MLNSIGVKTLEELIDKTIPASIRNPKSLQVPEAVSEAEYLDLIQRNRR